ncbi:MAG: hypothetical protein R2713_14580 [Ilumatobacteraceae bacterium]
MTSAPIIPHYRGPNVRGLIPAFLGPSRSQTRLDPDGCARQVVLLAVLDGLGWDQLQARRHLAPTLSAMVGGPITTVCPTGDGHGAHPSARA